MEAPLVIQWFGEASKRTRWLVGVSGGADSMALLHLMVAAGFRNLVVCHLNHRLRGRASAGDARFVGSVAKQLELPCEIGTTDWPGTRGSIETAARRARHAFFADCARKWRCRRVVLAHHADDQCETILWNLLRGSHGLKGISPFQEIRVGRLKLGIHRPLLETRRACLRQWLMANHLKWREDATNAQPIAIRNRLRHEIVPLLDAITGRDATASLLGLAAAERDNETIRAWALERANLTDPAGRMHLAVLRGLPEPLQKAAFVAFLKARGIEISRAQIARCMLLLDAAGPSRTNLSGGSFMRRRAGRIWIEE